MKYIVKAIREDRPSVLVETCFTQQQVYTFMHDIRAEFPGKWRFVTKRFDQCDTCTKEAGYRVPRRDCKHD